MLTGKQKRFLRALGHARQPVIMIGKGEVTPALINETNDALAAHELIKVKMLESCPLDRHQAAAQLAEACQADVAQVLGRTFLLYRRADEPKLALPATNK